MGNELRTGTRRATDCLCAMACAGMLLVGSRVVDGAEPQPPKTSPQTRTYLVEARLCESEIAKPSPDIKVAPGHVASSTPIEEPADTARKDTNRAKVLAALRASVSEDRPVDIHLGRQLYAGNGDFVNVGTWLAVQIQPAEHGKIRVKFKFERNTALEKDDEAASDQMWIGGIGCVVDTVMQGPSAGLAWLPRLALATHWLIDPDDEADAIVVTQGVKVQGVVQVRPGKPAKVCDVTDGAKKLRVELTVREWQAEAVAKRR